MSPQADFVVSNGTGAAVRSDINGQLAAIVSNSSGASEPATMYAYQWWADTTTGLLKIRNAANSAWVTIGTLASTNLGLLPVAGGTMTGVLAVTAGTAALPGIAVSGDPNTGIYSPGADQIGIATGGTASITIDSSGRLLVGTSSARGPGDHIARLQVEGTGYATSTASVFANSNDAFGSYVFLGKSRGTAVGSNTVVQSGDSLGQVRFSGTDGTGAISAAFIETFVDGTPGTNDMPGRLVFSTTADGAASPTERMRIDNAGGVFINRITGAIITSAERLTVVGAGTFQRASGTPLHVDRTTNDGNLVEFYQDTAIEGSISVSGNTVSLNGAHLSRWSQLPGNGDRVEILRGTVLSNLDEMCDWGEQTNEQLNRMKVSEVEGDLNVSGVFQTWDDDDTVHTKDFYCAMTGDFIIRIAEGTTVERGDLLMSAGDGTAKPQDDDIIRSKTVAKVTSTHVTCTYEDGSYCVPCVLMAC
jgi:hypothetical protein